MTAMTRRITPTQRRKLSDCTNPPVRRRTTAMTMTTMSKIFMGFYFLVLVLFDVIATFALGGLVPVNRIIADAGGV
jgi:hypothetical protein